MQFIPAEWIEFAASNTSLVVYSRHVDIPQHMPRQQHSEIEKLLRTLGDTHAS